MILYRKTDQQKCVCFQSTHVKVQSCVENNINEVNVKEMKEIIRVLSWSLAGQNAE